MSGAGGGPGYQRVLCCAVLGIFSPSQDVSNKDLFSTTPTHVASLTSMQLFPISCDRSATCSPPPGSTWPCPTSAKETSGWWKTSPRKTSKPSPGDTWSPSGPEKQSMFFACVAEISTSASISPCLVTQYPLRATSCHRPPVSKNKSRAPPFPSPLPLGPAHPSCQSTEANWVRGSVRPENGRRPSVPPSWQLSPT